MDSDRVVRPYLTSPANDLDPRFSPDGRWVTVTSDQSGHPEVYARSFPDASAHIQISSGGALSAFWSLDGKTVYYLAGRALMAARLETTPTLRVVGRDTVVARSGLLDSDLYGNTNIARDGRFLGVTSNRDDFQLVVVPNWLPELRQRLSGTTR
jgi:Tol biopolymer transport system component